MAATKVFDSAEQVKPYVQRALQDEAVREHVMNAFTAARAAAKEFNRKESGVIGAATAVAVEPEILINLRKAVAELRVAAERVQRPPRHRSHGGRRLFLLTTGFVLGALYNPVTGPETRKWLSDTLFGGGDDFTYEASEGNGTNI